jgi:2-succinyl-5-enolpyruvyl-6-hydroxy-3-cyclohexene-1-carboxylate synthase
MYTRLENVQIVIALLKEHGIKHLVLSAGQSNYPFVHSVENDPYFTCYSVVDERSAAFFALGIAQEMGEPVAISCTASTACCNYISAITEAYYQKVPILVLTSDRDVRKRGQLETLMIEQDHMFRDITKMEVTLPDINQPGDFRYCERMVNEAILELEHRGKGPVHINMPSYGKENAVDVENLPQVHKINRFSYGNLQLWDQKKEELQKAGRIMLLIGQHTTFTEQELSVLDVFQKKYNCVIVEEHMGNVNRPYVLNMNPVISNTSGGPLQELAPEILITMGTHIQVGWDRFAEMQPVHWCVNENGDLIDACESLTDIFECTDLQFLEYFTADVDATNDGELYGKWQAAADGIICPELPLCHVFSIQNLLKRLPEKGILHLSIQNSIRLSQYFQIPEGIKCYANLGALGIDGSMSTFLGQAAASPNPAFLIIGDLSFFYDMNCLKIRHIQKNVHIMLLNNGGGAEFYQNNGMNDTLDLHTAARHHSEAMAWALACGFVYYGVRTKDEYMDVIDEFAGEHDAPCLLEVFTDLETDMTALRELNRVNCVMDPEPRLKAAARKVLGPNGVAAAKKVIAPFRKG